MFRNQGHLVSYFDTGVDCKPQLLIYSRLQADLVPGATIIYLLCQTYVVIWSITL